MSTRLDPPTVPPLTPAQRARLRNRVMDTTQPARRTTYRWLAPVIAVGAVAAVVAGTLVVTNRHSDAPEVAATTPTPTLTQPPMPDIPTNADLGQVPAAEAAAAAATSCRFGKTFQQPPKVLWARRTSGDEPGSRTLLLLLQSPSLAGGNHGQGVEACLASIEGSTVPDAAWATQAPEKSLVLLTDTGHSTSGMKINAQWWAVYRTGPQVARIEARYVLGTTAGPWIKGVVADGYAYADSRIQLPGSEAPPPGQSVMASAKIEVRAYDKQGAEVPVPQPRH